VNTLTDEFRIDEQTMNEAIDLVKEGGDLEHRMLYHILRVIVGVVNTKLYCWVITN
jgi:hypothetical protein